MSDSPSGGSEAVADLLPADRHRVRIRIRRRRAREGSRWRSRWPRSRRRALRNGLICAGVLVLMGTGLYYSLAFLGSPPTNPRAVVRGTRN